MTHLSAVGIDVNAAPLNRSPSTATFPEDTVKSADPRLPAIAPRPGRVLKIRAVLFLGPSATLEAPMVAPDASRTMIETVANKELGLTMATDVVYKVSSQMRVLDVEEALESGTTPS